MAFISFCFRFAALSFLLTKSLDSNNPRKKGNVFIINVFGGTTWLQLLFWQSTNGLHGYSSCLGKICRVLNMVGFFFLLMNENLQ